MGPKVLYEHPALVGCRAVTAQVDDDGAASIAGKRKDGASTILAGIQPDRAVAPVNVIETEVGNLTGPKPQCGETPHDGAVPLPERRGDIQRRRQLFELFVP